MRPSRTTSVQPPGMAAEALTAPVMKMAVSAIIPMAANREVIGVVSALVLWTLGRLTIEGV